MLVAITNCLLRGGLIKRWFPGFKGGKSIFSLLYGLYAGIASMDPVYGLLMTSVWLGCMPPIFDKEGDDYIANGQVLEWIEMVLVRGMVFALPIFIATIFISPDYTMLFVPSMTMMPVTYSYNWWMKKEYWIFNKWTLSEITYGFLLGLPLDIMILQRFYT